MKGKETCCKVLIRIMVSCSEVNMLKVRSEFKREYDKSLNYHIQQVYQGRLPESTAYTCLVGMTEAHDSMSIQEGCSFVSSSQF